MGWLKTPPPELSVYPWIGATNNPENVQKNESVTSEDSASTNIVNMASLLLIDLNPLKTKKKINNNSIL